jgi:tetratricopeptide (TPR) repeat protein
MVQLITIFIILFTLFANPVHGAEKPYKRSSVVKSYRTCMKEKNFAQARQVLTDAMREHPEAAADAQMYRYKLDALDALIGVENRKIYLNSKPDTVSFFNYMYELYVTGLQCDSVEQQAMAAREAEGKKAQQKLRGGVGQTLLPYRKNLLNAGKYYYTKKSYADAFRFFDMYVQTKSADVFQDSKGNSLVADPDDEVDVSVLSVLSAYASSNYSGVMSYLTESLKDENLRPQMLEIGVKTYAALTDTTKAVQLLEQGFEAYPEVEYFYVTLVKHYNERGLYEQALQKVQRMTSLKPQQRDYWYVAGTELVLLDRYDEALQSFQQCIDIKADDAEAWASMGSIQLHQAHVAYENFNLPKSDPSYNKQKNAITQLYRQACNAFEQSRKFDEANTSLWLEGLRETYFKLNRGKALKGLEKYK